MNGFDRLHPALQHHIVNSLGWRELRPFQDAAIGPILDEKHLIVLAPTAGGKTEAACFPVLSRMLSEGWSGLSVLYICPIKALLNNLDVRLRRYCGLLGRRAELWHGDVKSSVKKRMLNEPPDLLLTTPESLEVMLVSPSVDAKRLFASVQAVIVDEIHAFAGDDRGWHLLSVLERVSRLADRELQRIGLSATVGNPEMLADWLAGSCRRSRDVFRPAESVQSHADVQLDFVGSLSNAAIVISRLHHGEKRLVFVDSRASAERLAAELRQLQVTTFVTHSSLSHDQRRQAEEAFASRDDCVIVATSVLELGVDVGNLDRVIQIDSPATVASFLQRMGRTGRRAGLTRNCLFLATKEPSLLQAAGLIELWRSGYVEPIEPPPLPMHVLAQQLMALTLQESGVGRSTWYDWIRGVSGFAQISAESRDRMTEWMIEREIVWSDAGILAMGREGEATFGRKHFLELLSVFTTPPLFAILSGRHELGFVDVMTFVSKQDGPLILLLGGRPWHVTHIDWQRRMAYVEPTDAPGRSRWQGEGQGIEFELCQAIKRVLVSNDISELWSQRAKARIEELRQEYAWIDAEATTAVQLGDGTLEWWTFAGRRVNATLAGELQQATGKVVRHNSVTLTFESGMDVDGFRNLLEGIRKTDAKTLSPRVADESIDGLKFSECLPRNLAIEMLRERLRDPAATSKILEQRVQFVDQP